MLPNNLLKAINKAIFEFGKIDKIALTGDSLYIITPVMVFEIDNPGWWQSSQDLSDPQERRLLFSTLHLDHTFDNVYEIQNFDCGVFLKCPAKIKNNIVNINGYHYDGSILKLLVTPQSEIYISSEEPHPLVVSDTSYAYRVLLLPFHIKEKK